MPLGDSDLSGEKKRQYAAYGWLTKVWQGFAGAVHDLSGALGIPLCVEGCGLCCTSNTPTAWQVEVLRAADYLNGRPRAEREAILDKIETWLVKPVLEVEHPLDPLLSVRQPRLGHPGVGKEFPVPNRDIQTVQRGRCPLLGADMRCTVYEVRPLGCRAWGVTTAATDWCKRPKGRGERDERERAFLGGEATASLRAALHGLWESVKDDPALRRSAIFPTALYARFREQRLVELLPHIPTARLVGDTRGQAFIGLLFQEQNNLGPEIRQLRLVEER